LSPFLTKTTNDFKRAKISQKSVLQKHYFHAISATKER
jgi:hypothetical protein